MGRASCRGIVLVEAHDIINRDKLKYTDEDKAAILAEYDRRRANRERAKDIEADFKNRRIPRTFQNWRTQMKKAQQTQEAPMSEQTTEAPVEELPGQMSLETADTPLPVSIDTVAPSANLPEVLESTDPLEFHELANHFPLIEGEAFQELCDDIQASELHEPITLYQGKLLDGRNRYRACQAIGIPYRYKIYTGEKPVAFVVSANLVRRHLNDSQRAMIAAGFATMRQGTRTDLEPSANVPEVSQPDAAAMLNVSERSVRDAKVVQAEAVPEIQTLVKEGELAVSTAREVADQPPEEQRQIAAEVKAGTLEPRQVRQRLKTPRTNGTPGGKPKPKPDPASRPPARKEVQDALVELVEVLSQIKDEQAWPVLVDLWRAIYTRRQESQQVADAIEAIIPRFPEDGQRSIQIIKQVWDKKDDDRTPPADEPAGKEEDTEKGQPDVGEPEMTRPAVPDPESTEPVDRVPEDEETCEYCGDMLHPDEDVETCEDCGERFHDHCLGGHRFNEHAESGEA